MRLTKKILLLGVLLLPVQGVWAVDADLPNVIFVLDNTSNWSRQAQQWPGGVYQGQSEVRAIKETLAPFAGRLNVGLVEYITGGASADRNAAYVRYDLQLYEDETDGGGSKAQFDAIMDKIFADLEDPEEKRDASNPYGDLTWDIYNYLSGSNHSNAGAGTPGTLADENAYTTPYSVFESPIVDASGACAGTYLIFIGNNVLGTVPPDDAANTAALKAAWTAAGAPADEWDALYGDSGAPLRMPEFEAYQETLPDTVIEAYCTEDKIIPEQVIPASDLGQSQACYNNASYQGSCTAAENSAGGLCVGQQNCYCTGFIQLAECGGSKGRFTVHTDGWTEPEQFIEGECFPEQVIPGETVTLYRPKTGVYDETGGLNYNFDDWAKFLHDYGIPRTVTKDGETYTENVNVKTYVIDAFNAQQSPELSSIWFSAAINGGGRYFQASNEQHIIYAINSALSDSLSACVILDTDGDGIDDSNDNCTSIPNPDQLNTDNSDDGGDACDEDDDNDNWLDVDDNCPVTANPQQEDTDTDGVGNVCDNCRIFSNPGQEDSNEDGCGDACATSGCGGPACANP